LLLTLIWGSSYILMKKGLAGFSAIEMACLRISISFVCALPLAVKAFKAVASEKYFTLMLIGFISILFPAFLFAFALTKGESAVNGILNALSPLWTAVIGYYFFKAVISGKKMLGVAIGFAGAVVLVVGAPGFSFRVDVAYAALPVIATLCYGLGTNLTKQKMQNENPIYTTVISMSFAGVPALIALFCTAAPAKIAGGQVWLPLAAIAALAIFGTFVAWILFYRLLQRTDMLFATSVTYLVPIVAVSWGILDGELLGVIQIGGMLLILAGVYFTTRA
jgi:drug/metabolite transporter (DMT)-like permease